MIRKILILSVGLFFAFIVSAKEEEKDTAFMNLYHRYYMLYDTDKKDEFYKASKQMQEYYLKEGNIKRYYGMRMNECMYDAEHGEAYKGIQKTYQILDDMKDSDKEKPYHIVYTTLGSLFDSRGYYRMAMYYYNEALDNVNPTDSFELENIYVQLVNVNVSRNVNTAEIWSNRLKNILSQNSPRYKIYLIMKGQIYFFRGEKDLFFQNQKELEEFKKGTSNYTQFGDHAMKLMEAAFNGKYNEALSLLEQRSQDYDDLKRCDIRVQIYKMMGQKDLAMMEMDKRKDIRDSLNNDMIFNNINEINTAVGVAKLNEKAAKEREKWMGVVIVLLFVTLGLFISRAINRQRYQKRILKQNEELEIALDEAKESERMKNIFIRHVTHEIRTPLNIITGYAQIISDPNFDVAREEQAKMFKEIDINSAAITGIVDGLLEISNEESKERYRKDDKIVVNDFCLKIIKDMEEMNGGRLKLIYQTKLPNKYAIKSNMDGIDRILHQLLDNALKFTEEGSVKLSAQENPADGTIRFCVTDTGVGIPEEQHEQVFEHFYQVDSFKQGLGIGLSMCRKIAILLGGSLEIDKDYHDGTRMVLTIPIK